MILKVKYISRPCDCEESVRIVWKEKLPPNLVRLVFEIRSQWGEVTNPQDIISWYVEG